MSAHIECPICKSQAEQKPVVSDSHHLTCLRCGEFSITGSAVSVWQAKNPSLRQVANASGWIRDNQGLIIHSNVIEKLLSINPPSVGERAGKLLKAVEIQNVYISDSFDVDLNNAEFWLGVSYSDNAHELYYLFHDFLVNEVGYLSFTVTTSYSLLGIQITPRGYDFLDSQKHSNRTSQIGFCAMWFDENVLPIWANAISPAIENAGYEPKRIDSHPHNNKIDDEIIAMIRRSKFVVADFTGHRGGVYFEAGFALGLGLQVIWTCEKSDLDKIHFDTRQYNFLLWEREKLDEFKQALQNRIEATLGHGNLL